MNNRAALTRDLVSECIREMGTYGCTREEIETLSGLSGNTIRPLVLILLAEDLIHESDERRATNSGHLARILRWGPA